MFLCVFFFKQKPAYEMRISDWSSDVCSSDPWQRAASLRLSLERSARNPEPIHRDIGGSGRCHRRTAARLCPMGGGSRGPAFQAPKHHDSGKAEEQSLRATESIPPCIITPLSHAPPTQATTASVPAPRPYIPSRSALTTDQ